MFCSYLITKTYKKTLTELSEFLDYQLPTNKILNKKIKIASIGGGPANDACALLIKLLRIYPDS